MTYKGKVCLDKKNESGLQATPFFAQTGPDNLFGWAVLWLADLSHLRCARKNFAIKMRHVQGSQVSPTSMGRIFLGSATICAISESVPAQSYACTPRSGNVFPRVAPDAPSWQKF